MLTTASVEDVERVFNEASINHILNEIEGSPSGEKGVAEFSFASCCGTAHELFLKYRGIELGIAEVDGALQGGIPSGFVVEIAGPSGVGKSRFVSLVAARRAVADATRMRSISSSSGRKGYDGNPCMDKSCDASSSSVLYLKVDHHARHTVRTLEEAVRYHSTIAWEKSFSGHIHNANTNNNSLEDDDDDDDDEEGGLSRFDSVDVLVEHAINRISIVDVASDFDRMLRDEGLRGTSDPLTDLLNLITCFLSKRETECDEVASSPCVIVVDSVGSLIKRMYTFGSGRESSEANLRHDAIASFLQGLKDVAATFNAVVFFTNTASTGDGNTDELEAGDTHIGRSLASVKGTFGTTFYHAVNIRLLLLPHFQAAANAQQSSVPAASILHIAKSPICSSRTYVLAGLLDTLECYELVPRSSHIHIEYATEMQGYRLRPSVRVVETLA